MADTPNCCRFLDIFIVSFLNNEARKEEKNVHKGRVTCRFEDRNEGTNMEWFFLAMPVLRSALVLV
jgi:hypothetical protein